MGVDRVKKAAGQLKPASQAVVLAALDKIEKMPAPAAPAPLTTAAAPAAAAQAPGSTTQVGPAAEGDDGKKGDKKPPRANSAASVVAPGRAKSAADEPVAELALINDGKRSQREKDEKALKVI